MSRAKADPGRIGVWGASGSGKSTYVKALLRGAGRVVVFDPLDEYRAEGFTRCATVAEVKARMASSFGAFRLALVPPGGSEAPALDRLAKLLRYAQEPYREGAYSGALVLVVEEMNLCFPVASGAARAPAFADLCSRGRHYGIGLVGVSQRIAEVSTRFRGNCSETVVFRQGGWNDLKAAADALGFVKPDDLRGLQNHAFKRLYRGAVTDGKNNLRS